MSTITDEIVTRTLWRIRREHQGHQVEAWWQQRTRDYVALKCSCGGHVDLPTKAVRDEALLAEAER